MYNEVFHNFTSQGDFVPDFTLSMTFSSLCGRLYGIPCMIYRTQACIRPMKEPIQWPFQAVYWPFFKLFDSLMQLIKHLKFT